MGGQRERHGTARAGKLKRPFKRQSSWVVEAKKKSRSEANCTKLKKKDKGEKELYEGMNYFLKGCGCPGGLETIRTARMRDENESWLTKPIEPKLKRRG